LKFGTCKDYESILNYIKPNTSDSLLHSDSIEQELLVKIDSQQHDSNL
jgi:hypothetical protein